MRAPLDSSLGRCQGDMVWASDGQVNWLLPVASDAIWELNVRTTLKYGKASWFPDW